MVVLIIGLLAAIAVPAFSGMRQREADAAVQSDLVTDSSAILQYGVDHDGDLPPAALVDEVGLRAYGFVRGAQVRSLVFTVQGSVRSGSWCLLATSSTSRVFTVSSHTGVSDGSTTSCPAAY